MGIPFSSPDEQDPQQYIDKAIEITRNAVVSHYVAGAAPQFTVYVVWFAKTLQNWKALLSTSIADGRYYELTYNGDKLETYVDSYVKEFNETVPDVIPQVPTTRIQGDI